MCFQVQEKDAVLTHVSEEALGTRYGQLGDTTGSTFLIQCCVQGPQCPVVGQPSAWGCPPTAQGTLG